MSSDGLISDCRAAIEQWEGSVNHLYLDTVGLVTTGIGCLINYDDVAHIGLCDRFTGETASAERCLAEWRLIHGLPHGKARWYYRPIARLRLPSVAINELFAARFSRFLINLRELYPNYNDLPRPAQVALADMIWNLGYSGLRRFSKLRNAIDGVDFSLAARECHRGTCRPERNSWTADMFLSATGGGGQ